MRARLQDELVALHDRLGTTIVFVTHDIDEAIKLGDRIAMIAVGGHLAQYATRRPTCWPTRPRDFVTEFLGGERTLRRLALVPLADLPLDPVLDAGLGGAGARRRIDVGRTAREALDLLLSSGAAVRGRDPRRDARSDRCHPGDPQRDRRAPRTGE